MNNLESIAKRLRKYKICNEYSMRTINGDLDVTIYDYNGSAMRVTRKNGECIGVEKVHQSLLQPINPQWKDFQFGGF